MIDLEGILNLQYAYNYAPHLHTVRTFTAQFIEVWQHAVALKKEILLFLYIKTDRLGTVLEPLCLQIEWVNFVQILRLFEISNSN